MKLPNLTKIHLPGDCRRVALTHLVTGRPYPHFHSWTHYAWQAQEMWPDMYVQMHPDKAAKHNIEDGQEISIETEHGTVQARAWLYAGIRPDTVFVPIGWDATQPYHPWNSVNYLMRTSATHCLTIQI